MTAQCHTAHRVSPHQAGRERETDREREKVDRESEKKVRDLSQSVCVCLRSLTAIFVRTSVLDLEGEDTHSKWGHFGWSLLLYKAA